MKKRKRIIIGVLFLALIFAAFVGFQNVFKTSNVAEVSKNKTIAPTTDGKSCANYDEMASFYGADVEYNSDGTLATIKVNNGTFKASSVSAVNDAGNSVSVGSLISSDPLSMGNLTQNSPMKISIASGADGTVTIHFVLAKSDENCLAYDLATNDDSGQKTGTYEMDVILELNPIKPERGQVENTNYNKICKVFRTGEGYSDYKSAFQNGEVKVSKADIEKYNYSVASQEQRNIYDSIMSYCVNDGPVSFNYTEEETVSLISAAITIAKTQDSVSDGSSTPGVDDDFMKAFNEARDEAKKRKHDFTDNVKDGTLPNDVISLTCDEKIDNNSGSTTEDGYNYANTDYFYAKEEEKKTVTYEYTYTSGEVETGDGGNCTRTCEEAVVVEYGPPVASKAGLCFEYRVRVTSRVVCSSALKLEPPKTPSICTPTPFCNSVPGKVHQGGPNGDFEACIQECDGGQYSEACSNKCYKDAYGSSSGYDPLAINDRSITNAKQLSAFPGYSGRYEWRGNSIVWTGVGTYARWYQENEPTRTRNDHDYAGYVGNGGRHKYLPGENGFKRQNFTNGLCTDPCYWSGCSRFTYLNDSDAAKDTVKNLQKYNEAIATCTAAASCTTKTAEFNISVDYKDSKNVEHTVEFPLTTSGVQNAQLVSHNNDSVAVPSGSEIFIPDTFNKKGYAGCYESKGARNWYQAAWSFPGSWINNKTGEISYEPKNDNGWQHQKNKFCIPLDAKSVNVGWWEKTVLGDSCYTDEEITEELKGNMNINANTKDFGYFGWNFNFKCFYALKNEAYQLDKNGDLVCPPCTDDCDTTTFEDYTFRVVDLNKLFPDAKNETANNSVKLESETASSLNLGRQPGFNWTLGSTDMSQSATMQGILGSKNDGYLVNPLKLIEDIQEKGNSIYNGESYRDYLIVLNRDTLIEIRDFNKEYDKSYSDYTGSILCRSGKDDKCEEGIEFTYYHSDLLDKLGSDVVKERGTAGKNREEGR